jgi:hypothetical protein
VSGLLPSLRLSRQFPPQVLPSSASRPLKYISLIASTPDHVDIAFQTLKETLQDIIPAKQEQLKRLVGSDYYIHIQ